MTVITEAYRELSLVVLKKLISTPEEWSFNVVALANELAAALEANRPSGGSARASHQPIVAIDVDGVLHRYTKWKGADVLDGGPTRGSMEALKAYVDAGYEVHIVSSRLHQPGGMVATRNAIREWLKRKLADGDRVFNALNFSLHRPPAVMSIDDRAFRFVGRFPTVEGIKAFKPFRDYDNPENGADS